MFRFPKRNPFVWSYLRPFWPQFLWIGAILLAQIFLSVIAPLPTKFILNNLLKAKPEAVHDVVIYGIHFGTKTSTEALLFLTILTILVGALLLAACWVELVGTSEIVFKTRELMRQDLLAAIFSRDQRYLDSKRKVDLLGRFSGDVENTEILLVNGVPAALRDVPILFVMIAMMLTVNVRLTVLFVALLPVAVFGAHFFTQRNRRAAKVLRRHTVHFEEETYELLHAMSTVKSLRAEARVSARSLARVRELTGLSQKERDAAVGLDTTVGSSAMVIKALFLLFGGQAIFRGEIGWGDLFQVLAYIEIFNRHVNNLTKFVAKYPKCIASVERLEELKRELDLHPEQSGPYPVGPATFAGGLEFRGVSLKYGEGAEIFRGFTHAFRAGVLTVVVGQSGIGKSSFAGLLNRLRDPDLGSITAGGRDLRDYELGSLRSAVRIVAQEPFLLAASVRENLQLAADRKFADAELWEALARVNAETFVAALPQGLETPVGESGLPLSGGQAKRLHLARAFLDPGSRVVLFDEPTTGLDTHSAERVMASIAELRREKCLVFWITHRMLEVKAADQVLFFVPGGNPAVGTPARLLSENARFRALMMSDGKSGARASIRLENFALPVDTERGLC